MKRQVLAMVLAAGVLVAPGFESAGGDKYDFDVIKGTEIKNLRKSVKEIHRQIPRPYMCNEVSIFNVFGSLHPQCQRDKDGNRLGFAPWPELMNHPDVFCHEKKGVIRACKEEEQKDKALSASVSERIKETILESIKYLMDAEDIKADLTRAIDYAPTFFTAKKTYKELKERQRAHEKIVKNIHKVDKYLKKTMKMEDELKRVMDSRRKFRQYTIFSWGIAKIREHRKDDRAAEKVFRKIDTNGNGVPDTYCVYERKESVSLLPKGASVKGEN